jgi:hypothetical protein
MSPDISDAEIRSKVASAVGVVETSQFDRIASGLPEVPFLAGPA